MDSRCGNRAICLRRSAPGFSPRERSVLRSGSNNFIDESTLAVGRAIDDFLAQNSPNYPMRRGGLRLRQSGTHRAMGSRVSTNSKHRMHNSRTALRLGPRSPSPRSPLQSVGGSLRQCIEKPGQLLGKNDFDSGRFASGYQASPARGTPMLAGWFVVESDLRDERMFSKELGERVYEMGVNLWIRTNCHVCTYRTFPQRRVSMRTGMAGLAHPNLLR